MDWLDRPQTRSSRSLTMCLPCLRTPVHHVPGLYIVRCADCSCEFSETDFVAKPAHLVTASDARPQSSPTLPRIQEISDNEFRAAPTIPGQASCRKFARERNTARLNAASR